MTDIDSGLFGDKRQYDGVSSIPRFFTIDTNCERWVEQSASFQGMCAPMNWRAAYTWEAD